MYGTCGRIDNKADFDLTLTFVSNSDPCQITTPPSIGRFRVRCGGGVRVRQSYSERG